MFKFKVLQTLYKYLLRPILFKFDAEKVHNLIINTGHFIGKYTFLRWIFSQVFSTSDKPTPSLVYGIKFPGKVGLAAGFDYDGLLANTLSCFGFGYNTVGTVTAKPYEGNTFPRLGRLVQAGSLFVNKGFKSCGAKQVADILDKQNLDNAFIGVSIGSSNVTAIKTIDDAIADYLETFSVFKDKRYVKYFELNVSCPNITLKDAFTDPGNFEKLLSELKKMDIVQPIFVKMPSEISFDLSDTLVTIALKYSIFGFIFSNLVKNRNNPYLLKYELDKFLGLSGNFSGKPVEKLSNELIKHTREKFGDSVFIIGCGGVFSYRDAKAKLDSGANLVQLITGLIFEGPQLPSQINLGLSKNV